MKTSEKWNDQNKWYFMLSLTVNGKYGVSDFAVNNPKKVHLNPCLQDVNQQKQLHFDQRNGF